MLITNASVWDGHDGSVHGDQYLVIEDGRVTAMGPMNELARSESQVIDAAGLTAMPGLIDCHVHLAHDGEPDWTLNRASDPASETLKAVRNAVTTLRHGVTTVRDCGSNWVRAPLALSKLPFDRALPLPRILSCGSFITMTGGHVHWEAVEADGTAEVRKAVRRELKAGAQWIKVIATGGVLTPGTDVGAASYTRDELSAATAEATSAGRAVAAHAIGNQGIKNALAAGAKTIEHGSFLDDEAVEMMADRGAVHVSTLSAYHQVVSNGIKAGVPEQAVRKAEYATTANQESFRRSLDRGINIAAGTDAGTPFNHHGAVALELRLMVEAGASNIAALRSATSGAAAALGIDGETGALEVGKCADVLLLAADPTQDITAVERPVAVIRSGELIVGTRDSRELGRGLIDRAATVA